MPDSLLQLSNHRGILHIVLSDPTGSLSRTRTKQWRIKEHERTKVVDIDKNTSKSLIMIVASFKDQGPWMKTCENPSNQQFADKRRIFNQKWCYLINHTKKYTEEIKLPRSSRRFSSFSGSFSVNYCIWYLLWSQKNKSVLLSPKLAKTPWATGIFPQGSFH